MFDSLVEIWHLCNHAAGGHHESLNSFFAMLLSRLIYSIPGLVISKLREHLLELGEVDQTIAIGIHLSDDCSPYLVFCGRVLSKNRGDLLSLDRATTIFIEEVEGGTHVLLVE